MTREMDQLLERIDRDLAACDARALPPLTSGPAAAALDLAELAGIQLDRWQKSIIRGINFEADAVPAANPPACPIQPAAIRGFSAGASIVDEVASWARRLDGLPKPLAEIKLTAAEWEGVKAMAPPRPSRLGGELSFGVPVRLVDDPKESTLYRPPPADPTVWPEPTMVKPAPKRPVSRWRRWWSR